MHLKFVTCLVFSRDLDRYIVVLSRTTSNSKLHSAHRKMSSCGRSRICLQIGHLPNRIIRQLHPLQRSWCLMFLAV